MGLQSGIADEYLRLYRSFVAAREIDRLEVEFVRRGEAFFQVSATGQETSAALGPHLIAADYLHLHYRDKALLIDRGLPFREFFESLLCTDRSHSRGRQMSAHLCDRALNILSTVGPVGNNALQAVGGAAEIRGRPERPIVVCSLGDGTTQEGEFFEAVAEAVRETLPVLFLVHDNGWSISTPTRGRTFLSRPDGDAREFYGLPITCIDGRDPLAAYASFGRVVNDMRQSRSPAIVWLKVDRLCDHTHADDQSAYRDAAELHATAQSDPVSILSNQLLALGADADQLSQLEADVRQQVAAAAELAAASPDPQPIFTAKAPLPASVGNGLRAVPPRADGSSIGVPSPTDGSVGNGLRAVPSRTDGSSTGDSSPTDDSVGNGLRAVPSRADGSSIGVSSPTDRSSTGDSRNGTESVPYRVLAARSDSLPYQTMREAICETLRNHLAADPRVSLFGQDIEDPKGDVFGVTRGLSTAFPGRVSNAPLAEATIIGKSIGRAGWRPPGGLLAIRRFPAAGL